MTTHAPLLVPFLGELGSTRDKDGEHAGELASRLTSRGMRVSVAPLVGEPAGVLAVSAQRVDVHPYAGRLVVLLPSLRDPGELYWHWQRPFPGRRWIGARWFQPFRPASEPEAAADAVEAAIDADVRARARSAHIDAEPGGGVADFERQILVRMGRPLYLLVYRILAELDSVEKQVEDTYLLHELLKIDHLTTRVLRGLERQAALGGATARRVNEPLTLAKVMRQAVTQVEQYRKVRVQVPPPDEDADLPGYAGPEITLLLAELVENATKFSPHDTEVQMAAVPVPGGVNIEITDRGLPMTSDLYTSLNRLLADPDGVSLREQILAGPIGLLVVAGLARRHGIKVTLQPAGSEGTRAVVALPAALLTAPRPAGRRSLPDTSARRATSGTDAQFAHGGAPGPAVPPQQAPPQDAVNPSDASPDTGSLDAPSGVDSEGRPALPQRRRKRGPEGAAPAVAADAEDGHPTAARHVATSQAGGRSGEPGQGTKRGPAAGLLNDFAGAARHRRQADDSAGQGPEGSKPPSIEPAIPPSDPAAGPAPQ